MKTKTEGKTRGLFTIMMAFMLIVTSAIVYNPKVVKAENFISLKETNVKLRNGQTIIINNNDYTVISGSMGTYYVSDGSTDLKLTKVKTIGYMREENKLMLSIEAKVKQGRRWGRSSLDKAYIGPEAMEEDYIRVEGSAYIQTLVDAAAITTDGTRTYKVRKDARLQCFGIETSTSGQAWARSTVKVRNSARGTVTRKNVKIASEQVVFGQS